MSVIAWISRLLDRLYRLCGGLSALFLLAMLAVICLQMAARWSGQEFPGSTAYAGYCMAAASFLAIAYTLRSGAHIRVSLLLVALGRWRRFAEIWCLAVASFLSVQLAWFAIKATYYSHLLNDISQDMDATPLWIPQIAMSAGAVVAAICFVDNLIRAIASGKPNIQAEIVSASPIDEAGKSPSRPDTSEAS